MSLSIVMDRTPVIRASLHDVERTLAISSPLVILGGVRVSPECAGHPDSGRGRARIADFHVRRVYVLGYSLDNLSLMALTIATGFVVDDAIVVLENITRYREQGIPPMERRPAGAWGYRFYGRLDDPLAGGGVHPDFLMGGMLGRLFREFCRHAFGGDSGVVVH